MQSAGLQPARGWAAQGGESSRPGRGGAGEEVSRPKAGGGWWWVVAQAGAAARARAAERRGHTAGLGFGPDS